MTTFLFDVLAGALLTGVPASSTPVDPCGNVDPSIEQACIAKRITRKEHDLAAVYARATAAVRQNFARYGRQDSRASVVYLSRSQTAWKQFVDNDCTVQAAFGGGSNSSISERLQDCYEEALDRRIEFLGQLADRSFGTG